MLIKKPAGQFVGVLQDIGLHQLKSFSNLLSISRVVLAIPMCWLLLRDAEGDNYIALGLMVIAALTDYFDGYFARKLNQISELGKVLDPLADKICILAVALCLASPEREIRFPFTLFLFVALRDITVVVCGYWAYRAKGLIMVSNWWGKWSSSVLAVLMIVVTLNVPPQPWYYFFIDPTRLYWIALVLLLISSLSYLVKFLDVVAGSGTDSASST
ncbi:MAG: CDP-alcohol phosphatidyltransferase family protein [bacterium]|nr:CDP-alcohol phosphatidyltransferase family protein [bacterium]